MKKVIFIFCLIAACKAQTNDETAIRNAMNAQLTAWNNGNIDAFMQTYWQSDSLLFVSAPPSFGWESTLEHYKNAYPDTTAMGKLSFNLLELKPLSPEYYFVVGEWHLKRTAGDIGGSFTLLFKKINSKWLIIIDHSN